MGSGGFNSLRTILILNDKKIFASSWNKISFTCLTRKFNRMILFLSIFGCQCSDDIIRNLSHLLHKSAQVPLRLFSISGKLNPQWGKDVCFHYVVHLKIPWKRVFFFLRILAKVSWRTLIDWVWVVCLLVNQSWWPNLESCTLPSKSDWIQSSKTTWIKNEEVLAPQRDILGYSHVKWDKKVPALNIVSWHNV